MLRAIPAHHAPTGSRAPRNDEPPPTTAAFGPFLLDFGAERLLLEGQAVALAPRYFAVLVHLVQRAGTLVTKEELLDAVWGHRYVSDSVLKVAVNAVRVALGDDAKAPRYLETVPRRGYRFARSDAANAALPAAPETPPTPAPAPSGSAGNLPHPATVLFGRAQDGQRLDALMARCRLVTLVGPGGVGKTALALAHAGQAPPADGVWLVRLDSLTTPDALVATIARSLQLASAAERGLAPLVTALRPLRLRLVLDNAEHLLVAVAELVAAILSGAPGVQLLVTSQRPLNLAEEQRMPLAPLALPPRDDAAAAARRRAQTASAAGLQAENAAPALQLLLARVHQADPAFEPGAADLAHAATICHALDGLPLALELAAARVPLLGLAGVSARLGERLALLTRGPRGADPRHQTLRAALDWTFSLLPAAELRLLQRLSVCEGGFTAEAAQALADPRDQARTLDLLQALHDHSLLNLNPGPAGPRLSLFDSVRALAAEQLHASGCALAAADAHLAWVLAWFGTRDLGYFETPVLEWLVPLRPEVGNLRAAMRHALADAARHGLAVELFAASINFRVRGGWRHEALGDLGRVRPLLREDAPAALRGRFCCAVAVLGCYGQVLPVPESLDAARSAEQLLLAVGDTRRAYLALMCQQGLVIRHPDNLVLRAEILQRQRDLEGPDWTPMMRRLRSLPEAMLLRDQGNLVEHEERCVDLIASSRARGDLQQAWVAGHGLSLVLFTTDRPRVAQQVLQGLVAEMRAQGCLREHTPVLALLATVSVSLDGSEASVALVREAVSALHAENMLWWMADALAWVPAWQGRWRDAARVQAWADALVARKGEKRGMLFQRLRDDFGRWLAAQAEAEALAARLEGLEALDDTTAVSVALDGPR